MWWQDSILRCRAQAYGKFFKTWLRSGPPDCAVGQVNVSPRSMHQCDAFVFLLSYLYFSLQKKSRKWNKKKKLCEMQRGWKFKHQSQKNVSTVVLIATLTHPHCTNTVFLITRWASGVKLRGEGWILFNFSLLARVQSWLYSPECRMLMSVECLYRRKRGEYAPHVVIKCLVMICSAPYCCIHH